MLVGLIVDPRSLAEEPPPFVNIHLIPVIWFLFQEMRPPEADTSTSRPAALGQGSISQHRQVYQLRIAWARNHLLSRSSSCSA